MCIVPQLCKKGSDLFRFHTELKSRIISAKNCFLLFLKRTMAANPVGPPLQNWRITLQKTSRPMLAFEKETHPNMTRQNKISFLCSLLLLGFILTGVVDYARSVGNNNLVFNVSYLFLPSDRFRDYLNLLKATQAWDPYSNYLCVYFPFTYVLLYPFTLFEPWVGLGLFVGSFLTFLGIWIWRIIPSYSIFSRITNTLTLLMLCYPVLFAIDRGNLELGVFILLGTFLFAYQKRWIGLALTALSAAIAVKLYPLVFLILFAIDRRPKLIAGALALSGLMMIVPLWTFEGSFLTNWEALLTNLKLLHQHYVFEDGGLSFATSLYNILKLILFSPYYFHAPRTHENLALFLQLYVTFGGILFLAASYFLVQKKPPLWMSVTFLTLAMILLPEQSHDYKLIHLFLPLSVFVATNTGTRTQDLRYLLLFGLMWIPKHYFFIPAFAGRGGASVSTLINPIVGLIFAGWIFTRVLKKDHPCDLA